MTTHSSFLAWRVPKNRGALQAAVHGVATSLTRLTKHAHTHALDNTIIRILAEENRKGHNL